MAGDDVTGGAGGEFEAQTRELTSRISAALAVAGPQGWRSLEANFALTVTTQIGTVDYTVDDEVTRVDAPASALVSARRLREALAATGEPPWWRMTVRMTADGTTAVEYDFGERPFPREQTFPPAAYREDLQTYPRDRVPSWLADYLAEREQPASQDTATQADSGEAGKGEPEPLPELPREEAISRVREYILDRGMDTTGYPLSQLKADRFSCGWLVYVPVPKGKIAIGRALFYIADDGVLEPSSSSVAPRAFVVGFEQRFRERQAARA
jgi:hypothetical protein